MARAHPAQRPDMALRAYALAYPGAHEDFPWGERVIKVGKKIFLFLGRGEAGLSVTVKLPRSATLALTLPFASPTGYGLGRSGWVSALFAPREKPRLDLLKQWIDESYRAIAPKALVAQLSAGETKKRAGPRRGAASKARR
jgi:predicted DNA-binding protein (MmcQ/YjbR family)